jgi:hypothetical protein
MKWWHWLLIYPTLGVSILTAAPQWIDKLQALKNNVRDRDYREAEEQRALYAKNLTCTTAPFDWFLNPDNVNLDATICESGDIYVRASAPGRPAAVYFVPLQRVLGKRDEAQATVAQASRSDVVLTSGPGEADLSLVEGSFQLAQSKATPGPRPMQQQMVVTTEVVCTKFIDKRMVLRHLRTPQACFDEVVDSYNGTTQKRVQVACRRTC